MISLRDFVSSCTAMLVRKALGGFRFLCSLAEGLGSAGLVSWYRRRNCIYKGTYPPAILFPFSFLLTQLFIYLN
jgi:hypothetical protein